MQRLIASVLFALLAFAASPSFAQFAPVILPGGCGTANFVTGSGYPTIDSSGKLCVNATVTASVNPFTPGASGARGTPFSVTSADSSGNLPTNAGVVVVSNPGANLMYCNVNGAAATASDQPITSGGGWFNFGIPTGVTVLHCIAPGGNTTANMVGGSGLATGTGGGGGGSSGGAVTLASGVPDSTQTFSITSSTNSTALALFGTQSVQFNLTGTFSATVTGQVSNDNSTWVNVPLLNMTTGLWVAPGTGVAAVGNYALAGTQGARYARVNVTYTSGTVVGNLTATSQAASATWGDYLTYQGLTGPMAALAATAWNTNTYGNGNTAPVNTNLNGNPFVSQSPAAPILASMQTAAVANGNGNNLNVTGTAGAVLTVNCATCSGGTQVNFQISQDGTNFASINAIQLPGATAPVTSTTTSGVTLWSIQVPAGATALRATVSAYSAGTVTVTGEAVPVGNGLPSASTTPTAGISGGASTNGALAPATPAAVQVKGSGGTIYGTQTFNIGTIAVWLKIYDSAAATCGSGTPIKRILVPVNSTGANGAGDIISFGPVGITTTTGISYCVTSGIADNDTGTISANTVAFNVDFK